MVKPCNALCWLIGAGAGAFGFWASVGAMAWLPALMIALAVGAFVALVLDDLVCGNASDMAEAVAATGADVEAQAADRAAARRIETKEIEARVAMAQAAEKGHKPMMLSAPQGGKPDDLKEIKGIGPMLEDMLHEMGIYHFGQIADWTDREVAWVDANLEGFRGRVSREDWVSQAAVLAKGGETEFSTRVGKGEVY